jgi:hypothetical protein
MSSKSNPSGLSGNDEANQMERDLRRGEEEREQRRREERMQEELELMNSMMITVREQIRRTRFLGNLIIMRQQVRYTEQLLGGGADEVRLMRDVEY